MATNAAPPEVDPDEADPVLPVLLELVELLVAPPVEPEVAVAGLLLVEPEALAEVEEPVDESDATQVPPSPHCSSEPQALPIAASASSRSLGRRFESIPDRVPRFIRRDKAR
jgi:hypothetical protein